MSTNPNTTGTGLTNVHGEGVWQPGTVVREIEGHFNKQNEPQGAAPISQTGGVPKVDYSVGDRLRDAVPGHHNSGQHHLGGSGTGVGSGVGSGLTGSSSGDQYSTGSGLTGQHGTGVGSGAGAGGLAGTVERGVDAHNSRSSGTTGHSGTTGSSSSGGGIVEKVKEAVTGKPSGTHDSNTGNIHNTVGSGIDRTGIQGTGGDVTGGHAGRLTGGTHTGGDAGRVGGTGQGYSPSGGSGYDSTRTGAGAGGLRDDVNRVGHTGDSTTGHHGTGAGLAGAAAGTGVGSGSTLGHTGDVARDSGGLASSTGTHGTHTGTTGTTGTHGTSATGEHKKESVLDKIKHAVTGA